MTTKTKRAVKMMTGPDGKVGPASWVSAYDKRRDRMVLRVEKRWTKMRKDLETLMVQTLADVETLAQAREKETGAQIADKGNFRVTSFDGNTVVDLRQSYRIFLDDRVKEARRLMIECASGIADDIKDQEKRKLMLEVVEDAFSASNTGSLSVGKILRLLRYKIKDPQWLKARKLLEASINPEKGKCYVAVLVRPSRQHDHERIKLDVADCWPMADEG